MLDLNQIESFYPDHLRHFKKNLLREYLQYKVLEIIFDSKWSKKMVFMGGTAIRILHAHTRFSEDLDFDNFGLGEKDFSALTDAIKRKLQLEGYQVEVKNVYRGAFRAYLRISNILFESGVTGHKQERLLIQVDTQPQNYSYQPEKVILNKFDIFLRIGATPASILLSQKIYCLFNRKRPMGRDFYDVVFLLGRSRPDMEYLKAKLQIDSGPELKSKLLALCGTLNFKDLSDDVRPFLIDPKDAKRVLFFQEYIQNYPF